VRPQRITASLHSIRRSNLYAYSNWKLFLFYASTRRQFPVGSSRNGHSIAKSHYRAGQGEKLTEDRLSTRKDRDRLDVFLSYE
jgi:hypothetical protein